MPTIKDVAREAGVSIATVSYVLNNKAAAISESTRHEVLAAVQRIGYTPNVTARNLKLSQSRLIGYAWHKVSLGQVNSVLDRFAYYLAHTAEAAGYHLLTFTYPITDPIPVYDELIRTGRVDAFVLADTTSSDERIRFLLDQEFPFVSFGRANPAWDFPYVDTDGRAGMFDAVQYLIELGHRRIACVGWPEDSASGNERVAGYVQALQNAGISPRPDYIYRGDLSEQTGRSALAYWCAFAPEDCPTAVVAVSDLMAIGVMNEAEQRGFVVGKTLSVVGFDDTPMVQYLRPALTTVQQPIPEIGQTLIAMLEALLDKRTPQPRQLLLPPTLVVRGSAGQLIS